MPSFVYIFEKFWRLKKNYLRNSYLKVTKAGFCSFYFDLIYNGPRINIKTKYLLLLQEPAMRSRPGLCPVVSEVHLSEQSQNWQVGIREIFNIYLILSAVLWSDLLGTIRSSGTYPGGDTWGGGSWSGAPQHFNKPINHQIRGSDSVIFIQFLARTLSFLLISIDCSLF